MKPKLTTAEEARNARLIAIGKRAILEKWYGHDEDYQTGIVAIHAQLEKDNPDYTSDERAELATELGNEAMSEIELEIEHAGFEPPVIPK